MSKLDMSWKQLKSNIKSCHLCEGLNSEELETLNAPEHKQLIREIYDSPQPLIKLENKRWFSGVDLKQMFSSNKNRSQISSWRQFCIPA